jgi:hypothetical protein
MLHKFISSDFRECLQPTLFSQSPPSKTFQFCVCSVSSRICCTAGLAVVSPLVVVVSYSSDPSLSGFTVVASSDTSLSILEAAVPSIVEFSSSSDPSFSGLAVVACYIFTRTAKKLLVPKLLKIPLSKYILLPNPIPLPLLKNFSLPIPLPNGSEIDTIAQITTGQATSTKDL